MKKMWKIGAIALVGVLVVGALAVWVLPGRAEAARGGRQGAGGGQAVAQPMGETTRDMAGSMGEATRGRGAAGSMGQATRGMAGSMGEAALAGGGEPGDLSPSEIEALAMALEDEYKAWAVYDQVIADLGEVRPFTQIVAAEQTHINALVTLLERYGLDVPPNEWPGHVPTFDTRAEACAAGVDAEVENAALYDELFSMVDNADIVRVFTALRQASLTKHLPAFERCAP